MRTIDIIKSIEKNIQDENKVRVYFKLETREPLWGKFVACDDHEELFKKGFVRFCINERYKSFLMSSKNILHTKIFSINSFFHIKISNNELQA